MPRANNPNTQPARDAKKRKAIEKRKEDVEQIKEPGTLQDVKVKMWNAINRLETIATKDDADDSLVVKTTHCLVQACGQYVKLLEVGEFEARIAALEQGYTLPSGDGATSQIPTL